MSVYIGDVQTFAGVIADKPQVLKIGEEAMEVFSAWEDYKECSYSKELHKEALVAEIADVIQACANLLAAVDVDDMRQPMQACYVRNSERGREYANDTFRAESDITAQDVDANGENVTQDSREQLEADIRCSLGFTTKDVFGWLDRQAAITHSIDAWNIKRLEEERESLQTQVDELQAKINEQQETLDNDCSDLIEYDKALNEAAGKWAKADARCFELQEQVDNQKKAAENFRDMWQKADARCSELKAENDGLKARIESLRSKLSKMLDAASEIQHIGDLP